MKVYNLDFYSRNPYGNVSKNSFKLMSTTCFSDENEMIEFLKDLRKKYPQKGQVYFKFSTFELVDLNRNHYMDDKINE